MNIKLKIVSFLFVLFIIPRSVFAASLTLESASSLYSVGQEFILNVNIDTEGSSINAVEGVLSFSPSLFELKEIRDGDSIINFWAERPIVSQQGDVSFSGIIPGGYQGGKRLLFTAVFKAKNPGVGNFFLGQIKVLQNDGKGTPVQTSSTQMNVTVSKNISGTTFPSIKITDNVPPEAFSPQIARSADLFNGQYFLVFATQDKGSGIAYYQVREGEQGDYINASSPYLIHDQKLDKEIFVKAVDKSGNERVETINPQNSKKPWYNNYVFLAIIAIVIFVLYFLYKKYHAKNY